MKTPISILLSILINISSLLANPIAWDGKERPLLMAAEAVELGVCHDCIEVVGEYDFEQIETAMNPDDAESYFIIQVPVYYDKFMPNLKQAMEIYGPRIWVNGTETKITSVTRYEHSGIIKDKKAVLSMVCLETKVPTIHMGAKFHVKLAYMQPYAERGGVRVGGYCPVIIQTHPINHDHDANYKVHIKSTGSNGFKLLSKNNVVARGPNSELTIQAENWNDILLSPDR